MPDLLTQLQILTTMADAHRGPNGEISPCCVEPEVFDNLWDELRSNLVASKIIDFYDDPAMRMFKFKGVLFARKAI